MSTDKEWLDSVNADRKKDNSNTVSCETFEIIMDRLEKEWFDLVCSIDALSKPSHDYSDQEPPQDRLCHAF